MKLKITIVAILIVALVSFSGILKGSAAVQVVSKEVVKQAHEEVKTEVNQKMLHFVKDLKNAEIDWKLMNNITKFLASTLTGNFAHFDFKAEMKITNTQQLEIDITNFCVQFLIEKYVIKQVDYPSFYLKAGETRVLKLHFDKDSLVKILQGGMDGVKSLAKYCDENYGGEVKMTYRVHATGWSQEIFSVRKTFIEEEKYIMMPGKDGLKWNMAWGDPRIRIKTKLSVLNDVRDPLFWFVPPGGTACLECKVENQTRHQTIRKEVEPKLMQAINLWADKTQWQLNKKTLSLNPGETKTLNWQFKLPENIEKWSNPYIYPALDEYSKGRWNDVLLTAKTY
jgi:hypothetical protein